MSGVWAHAMLDNPFWQYSLDRYAREDVAVDCLNLQKQYGIDVSLLLYGFWLAHTGRAIPDEKSALRIREHISIWRHDIVDPLRQSRINFKPVSNALPATGDPIRAAVKDLELHAEQIEQAMLFELTDIVTFKKATDMIKSMTKNTFLLLPTLIEVQSEITDLVRRAA